MQISDIPFGVTDWQAVEMTKHAGDVGGVDRDRQFALRNRMAHDGARQCVANGLAERVERFVHDVLQRSIVPTRRIFFCSSRTP